MAYALILAVAYAIYLEYMQTCSQSFCNCFFNEKIFYFNCHLSTQLPLIVYDYRGIQMNNALMSDIQ